MAPYANKGEVKLRISAKAKTETEAIALISPVEAELRAIWAGCELRNDRIRAVVPITFRPLDDSIRDCVESLVSVGGVEPQRRPG